MGTRQRCHGMAIAAQSYPHSRTSAQPQPCCGTRTAAPALPHSRGACLGSLSPMACINILAGLAPRWCPVVPASSPCPSRRCSSGSCRYPTPRSIGWRPRIATQQAGTGRRRRGSGFRTGRAPQGPWWSRRLRPIPPCATLLSCGGGLTRPDPWTCQGRRRSRGHTRWTSTRPL